MEIILPPQNKIIQDSEGNEENGYPDPDSNQPKKLCQGTQPKKLCQGTQQSPQQHSERINPASNH
jgi:hypothetical protein